MREVKSNNDFKIPEPTLFDRAISYVDPIAAAKRMQARLFMAMSGGYYGGSRSKRRAIKEWITSKGDADSDIIPDLGDLRTDSRDLIRTNPLAAGAIKTKTTSIGSLKLKSRIDREILGLSEEAADDWEHQTESEFKLWSDSTDCDVEDTLVFAHQQELCMRSTLESGDVFVLTPMIRSKRRTYSLQLQLIEADRVCNPHNASDSDTLSGGIERAKYGGAPVYCHIVKGHPGNIYSKSNEWEKIRFRGARSGRRNVLHLFHKIRVGQSRGVPDLAPVIESLKQLSRYTEAEINAAVISAFFTVFVTSEYGGAEGMLKNFGVMQPKDDIGGKTSDKDFKMGSGAIVDLAKGEDVKFANPQRPNQVFDQFVLAICRQVGVAIELPFEILVKHFTASYSAARAALLEAWKFYMGRRIWLAEGFCRPVYELWLTEAVLIGRIAAPGFLTGDPLIKSAWLGSEWIGSAKGAIDEQKEVGAARDRVEMGVSTLDEETIALTGGDWEKKHPQRAKEHKMRKEAGLIAEERTPEDETVVQDNGEGE